MLRKPHFRLDRQMLIISSEKSMSGLRQHRYHPLVRLLLATIVCAALGVVVGYCYDGLRQLRYQQVKNGSDNAQITVLKKQNEELEKRIADMESTIQVLSETVTQKTQSIQDLTQTIDQLYVPTEFPLTGVATMENSTESAEPMCIFAAGKEEMVIATANGTVLSVNDDGMFGHNVWIDHGNGYVTIYRNSGDVKVKQGEVVTKGTTLFIIKDAQSKLGYQIMLDGEYRNPMEILAISG